MTDPLFTVPAAPLEAVIATQVKTPEISDCSIDVPVPGYAIGRVYTLLAVLAPALNPV